MSGSRVVRAVLGMVGVGAVTLALGCAPTDSSTSSGTPRSSGAAPDADACAVDSLHLYESGRLTIATDSPAYEPWFIDNDPSNGKGFESAVAYAIADQMGFGKDQIGWTKVGFNASYQPGAKKFDFDINQISITAARAKAVTFSDPYYKAAQAIVTLKKNKFSQAKGLEGFAAAQLGAQVGTTSLQAIDQIPGHTQPRVYDDTNAATKALQNGQIDGLIVDLPTAFYITSAELEGSTITGQFQPETGQSEAFGLLFEKGNPLVTCVNQAIGELDSDGTLAKIEKKWLSQTAGVPKLD